MPLQVLVLEDAPTGTAPEALMGMTEDYDGGLFKWDGPLDARKIVERVIAGVISGVSIGVGFLAVQALFG